jgi:hypothetical protein
MVNSFVIMPGIGQVKKLNMNYILFPPRSGFVQQSATQGQNYSLALAILPVSGGVSVYTIFKDPTNQHPPIFVNTL